ncbi:monocarboxylate transporter 13-like [Apostichopus japonicus]|uniref:monocarboxylate transporter 13-like n=1 Tax=Stichopus japonicus TaxID=307972 RepID=UPI003AB5E0BD
MDKWIVLVACCARSFLVSGCLKSNGVLLDEMVLRLSTTHATVAWIFSLQNGLSYIMAPVTTSLAKTFGKRPTAICGGVLTGLSYIYCGIYVRSPWQLLLAFVVSGIGFGLMSVTAYILVKDHFKEEYPLMISVSLTFNYIGLALLPLLLQYFRDHFGQQISLVLFGAVLWNLVACGVAFREPRDIQNGTKTNPSANERRYQLHVEKTSSNSAVISTYFFWCDSLIHHPILAIYCIVELLTYYVYISWALFLVSLGTSAGLEPDQAVLLSTSGGMGGFLGKIAVVALFHYGKINSISGWFVPSFINGISLLGCALSSSQYILTVLTFISGFCLGVINSVMVGLLPTAVCSRHFQQAMVLSCICDGIGVQFGGFASGAIHDLFGSTPLVFVFDAVVCFISLPLILGWWYEINKDKDCTTSHPSAVTTTSDNGN